MNFLLIYVFILSVFTSGYSFSLSASEDNVCPPPVQIAPCTCFKSSAGRITALCTNFTDTTDFLNIFEKNIHWNLQDVHINQSVMSYLPAKILETARFQSLNVSHTTLNTLFDVAPVKTPELNLYLYNVKLLRGFQWSSIANSTLFELMTYNLPFRYFGKEFKDNIPKKVKGLWFENSKTMNIIPQAFADLSSLKYLSVTGGSLKTLTRDMFPKPTALWYLDFSSQKISNLQEGLLDDMPTLKMFRIEDNFLTTLSPKVFIKSVYINGLKGNPINCNCEIKWITATNGLDLHRTTGQCSEPESMKNTKLSALKLSDFNYCT